MSDNTPASRRHPFRIARKRRRGAGLLIAIFTVALSSVILLGLLQSSQRQTQLLQNTIRYERAVYLADAGVQHALAELQTNPQFRELPPQTEDPDSKDVWYAAEVAPDAEQPGLFVIRSVGCCDGVQRRLEVRVRR